MQVVACGSNPGRIFGAMFGMVTPGKYRFKRDFRRMKLLRDGEEVPPIFPGRMCEAMSIQGFNSIDDVGCVGMYEYRPDVFRRGHRYQLQVFSEEEPDKAVTVDLDGVLLDRICYDFELFRKADADPETGQTG